MWSTATASTPCPPPPACAAGLQPDLLSDAGWWQIPLWQYACYTVVIYSRPAAERLAVSVAEIARRIAARHGLELIA